MMRFPVILAHGALGPYDELIMFSAAAIFLIIMGISWVRSRNTRPLFEEENRDHSETEPQPQPDASTPSDAPDRFRLD